MNIVNYQHEQERVIQDLPDANRRLLLHSCCAPCSSYCLEYLRQYFEITVFYYNPNISFGEEYRHRAQEQKRLIASLNTQSPGPDTNDGFHSEGGSAENGRVRNRIHFEEGAYEPERFFEVAKGKEDCPEGGERCFACYELRIREAAQRALEGGFDYFTTTLTISPLKNAQKLNEIGQRMGEEYGVAWLPCDFKKRGGYQRSIELSKEYGLYRQDYCGCVFSKRDRKMNK